MRKVEFREWVKTEYSDTGKRKEGTGVYSPEYTGKGLFHQWGCEHCDGDDNDSVATDTVAIVELENGNVVLVEPRNVRFLDK